MPMTVFVVPVAGNCVVVARTRRLAYRGGHVPPPAAPPLRARVLRRRRRRRGHLTWREAPSGVS